MTGLEHITSVVRVHVYVCAWGCASLWNFVWYNQQQCVKLTHGTQSNVAENDKDEDNTANHISAAPEKQVRHVWHRRPGLQEENKVIYECLVVKGLCPNQYHEKIHVLMAPARPRRIEDLPHLKEKKKCVLRVKPFRFWWWWHIAAAAGEFELYIWVQCFATGHDKVSSVYCVFQRNCSRALLTF